MKYRQGRFKPRNKEKYQGDINNIWYRSSYELSFMVWLDKTKAVLAWSSEEIIVAYFDPSTNRMRRYFPDFWVKIDSKDGIKEHLIEIKPFSETLPPKVPKRKTQKYIQKVATYLTNIAKWEAATQYCESQGWSFKILTEKELFK